MEKFNLSRYKYYIFAVIIALIFGICVFQAFNYIPAQTDVIPTKENISVNVPSDEEKARPDEDKVESEKPEETSSEEIDIPKASKITLPRPKLEIIDDSDEPKVETKDYDEAYESRKSGDYYASAKAYVAKASYEAVPEKKAKYYEEAAISYAMAQRYGTALSYAQTAYNMYPTTSKELLLARLYYKTGDYDKANVRMNNILKRDFVADR